MYFLIEDKIVINQAENLILKSKNDAFRQHFWNMTFRQPRAKVVETVCIFIAIYCFYGSVDFCTPPPAAMLFRSDLFVARRSIVNIETGRGGEDSVEMKSRWEWGERKEEWVFFCECLNHFARGCLNALMCYISVNSLGWSIKFAERTFGQTSVSIAVRNVLQRRFS